MKRNDAIKHVVSELKVLREEITSGKGGQQLRFLRLSEVFKFGIKPSSDRFTAICLDEASRSTDDEKHLEIIDDILGDVVDNESEDDKPEEVTELIDFDGSMLSSKIPMGTADNVTQGSKKTTDDVVKATSQAGTWTGAGHYFKRYYGESVEEADMSKTLGYEETKDSDWDDTKEHFEDLGFDEVESEDRTETLRGPESLEDEKVKGAFTKQRITEKERLAKIAEDRARDMIEVILSNKSDDGELTQDTLLDGKVKSLVRLAKANGLSVDDLIDKLKSI